MDDGFDADAAWRASMRGGDFRRAWEISDRILAVRLATGPCWNLPRHEQWVWDGRKLGGKAVVVRCYHGLGDTIQFARFLPRLCALAREVTVWAQPALLPLLATMGERFRLLPLHDGVPEGAWEAEVELMELAYAFRTTLATVPATVPYFNVPPAPRVAEEFCVGVVAQAGGWDPRRSAPAELVERLGGIPGVRLVNLQPGARLRGALEAADESVLATAATVRALDLVVTVDTMMAHLAGALAAPTWTLLHADPDWRWMEGRADSPWYPTMRLFRQKDPGDWAGVFSEVKEALRERLQKHPPRARYFDGVVVLPG